MKPKRISWDDLIEKIHDRLVDMSDREYIDVIDRYVGWQEIQDVVDERINNMTDRELIDLARDILDESFVIKID